MRLKKLYFDLIVLCILNATPPNVQKLCECQKEMYVFKDQNYTKPQYLFLRKKHFTHYPGTYERYEINVFPLRTKIQIVDVISENVTQCQK